jgi:hypothetical protein
MRGGQPSVMLHGWSAQPRVPNPSHCMNTFVIIPMLSLCLYLAFAADAIAAGQREARIAASARSNPTRYLYPGVAALLLLLMFIGFQQFYLHGRNVVGLELDPAVKAPLIAHGVVATLWVLLFAVQPLLIASHRRRLHMTLGVIGVALAVCLVPLGIWSTIAVTRAAPDLVRFGLSRVQFTAIQFNAMLTFGTFVTIGIVNRHRPEIHRPMMLLATLTIMAAATSRITALREFELQMENAWGPLFGPNLIVVTIGGLFLATKTALTRSFDRWLAGGLVALAIASLLLMRIAPTATWERIAKFVIGQS